MRSFAQKQNQAEKPASSNRAGSETATPGLHRRADLISHLPGAMGNRAVQRILQAHAEEPGLGSDGSASPHPGHDFSRIPLHPPTAGAIQTTLAINAPEGNEREEADDVAEQVMRMPDPQARDAYTCGGVHPERQAGQQGRSNNRVQIRSVGSGDSARSAIPRIVHEALASPGHPLDPATRSFMELRFGSDFSRVRVHTGQPAARSAEGVGARAYTVGPDVVFGSGRYAPASLDGQRLLAHELTHVIQQRGSQPCLQRKPDPAPKPGVQFRFSVRINRLLNGDQLLLEFIKQYRGVATDAEAAALRDAEKWHWTGTPPAVRQADVDKGYILIPVNDQSITPGTKEERKERDKYFQGLPPQQQAAINAEVDRQFWEKTQYRVGQKLGASLDDKQMAEYWKLLRDKLILKQQAIDALPPDIRRFIFDENAPSSLAPKDFETVLRIVSKVTALTPAELTEYKSRVTAKTTDWSAYEASIDRFLSERQEREATAQERRTIETRLYGLDDLYKRYREILRLESSAATQSALESAGAQSGTAQPIGGGGLGTQLAIQKYRADLAADLVKAGFPGGIADFEKFIRDYEKAFERETLAIARVMLDQYEHLLWTQEQRYQKSGEIDALYQAVSQTKARAEYEEAEKIRSEHASSIVLSPDEMAEQAYWVGQRNAALARGEAKVRSAASAHPLVSNPDFDRERLARASKDDVRSLMLGYIAARRKDIADTRKNLADKPTMIYGLDALLKTSFQAQNVQSGTIYEKIIRNHISDVHWTEAIPQLVLAVIAIAAGLLTGGGGTIAVLAAGTALGVGAYQAIEEFRRYEMKSAAYGAQLTAEDPTMAWVIVAVIGAGIDAAAFALALPKLRPALEAFNTGAEANDVVKLTQKLDNLPDVPEPIRTGIVRAARAEAEARAAWKAVFHPPAALRAVIIPGAEEFGRFVYAVYLTIKRGIREFQVFVKTNEARSLIGDVAKLAPEELAALKTGYLQAIEEMEKVAAHGVKLGMTDTEVRAFMNLRGNTKAMTVEQVMAEMDAWKATKGTGIPFGFETAEQFKKFQATASAELNRLLRRVDRDAEAFLQGSSVTGVSYKRHLPFDVESDFDVAISSRYLTRQAEKLGYEVKLSPRRIGPLDPDQIAELGLGRFEERLGAVAAEEAKGAAKTRKINIMLFDNPEAVKKPIGAASLETERAAVPLKMKE